MAEHLRAALEEVLGLRVVGLARATGGSINDAYELHLADGRRLFCKTHPHPPPGFFSTEAAGLAWLAATDTVAVPAVVAVRDDPPAFLALDWIQAGRHSPASEARLGHELARLHVSGAPGFGWDRDGYVGDLAQSNRPQLTWSDFYGRERLEPLTRRAVDGGHLPAEVGAELDRLVDRLGTLTGPEEHPARLHGDLWGGNLVVDRDGRPWLVDPAPYGGHREVDLAMMRLFGGFGRRVFEAYEEEAPLAEGHLERVPLYQLYPLLVHTILFGGGYAGQVREALRHYH